MRRNALLIGGPCLLASMVIMIVITNLASTTANLQPLALIALILLMVGTLVTAYAIWDEVTGRPIAKGSPQGEASVGGQD